MGGGRYPKGGRVPPGPSTEASVGERVALAKLIIGGVIPPFFCSNLGLISYKPSRALCEALRPQVLVFRVEINS